MVMTAKPSFEIKANKSMNFQLLSTQRGDRFRSHQTKNPLNIFRCLIMITHTTYSLALRCVTVYDPGRNGTQCYHRGEFARGVMGKGESGRRP